MSKYYLKLNSKRCIRCQACEIQCQMHNKPVAAITLGELISRPPDPGFGTPEQTSAFLVCFQCEQPWCVAVCPNQAMVRRGEDGVVYVEKERCGGCQDCIEACPWRVPKYNQATNKVMKCDYCRDRLEQGLRPACVTACTTHALSFGPAEDDSRRTRDAYAKTICQGKKWVVEEEGEK